MFQEPEVFFPPDQDDGVHGGKELPAWARGLDL